MALRGYVTPTEVAVLCGYDYSDPVLLAEVAVVLEVVEQEVEMYCQTSFVNEVGTVRKYNGNGTTIISLGYFLRTLTSVWVLDMTGVRIIDLNDVVAMPSSPRVGAYRWIERQKATDWGTGGRGTSTGQSDYLFDNYFPIGLNNIEVTGDWGFVECPAPIKAAIAWSVKYFMQLRTYDPTKFAEQGISRNIQFTSSDRIDYLHPVSKKILDKWKNSRWVVE